MAEQKSFRLSSEQLDNYEKECLLTPHEEAALLAKKDLTIHEFACLLVGLSPFRNCGCYDLYNKHVTPIEQAISDRVSYHDDEIPF